MTGLRLIVRRAAEQDLIEAATWYDGQQPGLGDELLVEVKKLLETIHTRPESFPVAFRQARRGLLKRFPYAVYFRIKDDCISVIAVLHTSRDRDRVLPQRL
jgi:plasmid stabilization system protein ParE